MAHHFRLSSDILSPINSDISLNDGSAYSFESPADILNLDEEFRSIGSSFTKKNPKVQLKTPSKDGSTLEILSNSIKKQSAANAEKEDKFKKTYEQLKQSMDDLYFEKATDISILSPISSKEKCRSLETLIYEPVVRESKKKSQTSDISKVTSLPFISELQASTKISDKKSEDISKIRRDRKSNRLSKNASNSKESAKKSDKANLDSELVKQDYYSTESGTKSSIKASMDEELLKNVSHSRESLKKYGNKVNLDGELGLKGDGRLLKHPRIKMVGMVSSSTQTCESLQGASLNNLSEVANEEKAESLLSKYERQRRNGAANHVQNLQNKDLSIEKSIQIAVGIELDKVRGLMLDQNNCLLKEIFKLQDITRKQNEVTQYLFSIIEDLVEENKRLISKRN